MPLPSPSPSTALYVDIVGKGTRLVLVHGFTQTGRSWDAVAERLAPRHEVVLVDGPGHGRSAHVAADLGEGAALIGQVGGRASYVGYSMGGRFCLHLALASPQLVDALVLVGATAGIDDAGEREQRRADDRRLAERLTAQGVPAFVDEWLAGPLFARLGPAAAGRAARLENTVEGLSSSLRLAGTGEQTPLWDRLVELRMPVLLVAGAEDAKFLALARRMQACIGGNAELAVIEGAGHAVHLERPDQFADVIEAFLARHPHTSRDHIEGRG
ncbi:MAG: 2-succinyl-6-hydroxy-2,4-cyclohexadiene-carboxylate synthase [Acidimicrobiaceae bacterium]|nr:2-succinyl-6-hydroxy-2,4-cyclohexadiene-carboxylate synthase [Acidimicrobiaceae bacterium]